MAAAAEADESTGRDDDARATMLGTRGPQRGLFEADTLYADFVGRDTFYGWLASQRGELFPDALFLGLYIDGWGRPSVPPSLLATALVLQTYERVSDEEATQRAAYDLRWKVALGLEVDAKPFAKSTLQEFRAQLIVHEDQRRLFQESLELAKRRGKRGKPRRLKVALDTTPIFGRGAVKDTYNLLADGIVAVLRVLARQAGVARGDRAGFVAWATAAGYGRYVGDPSVKGGAAIDWDDPAARQRFLAALVADADRLLETVRATRGALAADSAEDTALAAAAGLLGRVLAQDIERREPGPALRQGTAPDRLVSVHDPEMRHGRKSAAKRFDGHKAAVAVDTDAQLITAVDVLAGNAPDAADALALVEQTEAATGCAVDETAGDCAYGAGETRRAFAAAGRVLHAKVPALPHHGGFPKTAFRIDLDAPAGPTCTCPGGHTTAKLAPTGRGRRVFVFPAAVCAACPLRPQCLTEPNGGHGQPPRRTGRTILLHPQEALLQQARAFQASPAFDGVRRRRQTVEHRIARLVQLGLRQARYVGRAKTLFQLAMAAAVANLTLLAAGDLTRLTPAAAGAALAGLLAVLVFARSPRPPPPAARRSFLHSWRHAAPVPALGVVTARAMAASRPDF
jgi:transposase